MSKNRTVSFFLVIFGIIAVVCGIIMMNSGKNYIETTAIITKIDVTHDTINEEWDYTVWVEYTVDGVTYNEELGYHENGYEEGKEIAIKYNPDNPEKIMQASNSFAIYLIVIGPVLMLVAVFLFIRQ